MSGTELFLTTQLIDMNIRVVMALNMFDELTNEGSHLDYGYLGQLLGIPIVPTTASKGIGIEAVLDKIIEVSKTRPKSPGMYILIMGQKSKRRLPGLKWRSPE